MVGHFFERLAAGFGYARDATDVYTHSVLLVAVALVPTVVRGVQVVRGGGTPEGSMVSETLVGLTRVALAVAVVSMAAGQLPAPATGNFPWHPTTSFDEWWNSLSSNLGEVTFDVTAYAIIYGLANLIVAGGASQPVLGRALRAIGVEDTETGIGLTRFVIKNQVVIPIALVHMLRVLRVV